MFSSGSLHCQLSNGSVRRERSSHACEVSDLPRVSLRSVRFRLRGSGLQSLCQLRLCLRQFLQFRPSCDFPNIFLPAQYEPLLFHGGVPLALPATTKSVRFHGLRPETSSNGSEVRGAGFTSDKIRAETSSNGSDVRPAVLTTHKIHGTQGCSRFTP